jgi:hypothetical protein
MSYQCDNCESLFFKILETRLCSENSAILYKKRCKRCKYKYLVRKTVPSGQVLQATHDEWLTARKIETPVKNGRSRISERPKILVGEYTQKISNPAGETSGYLHRIQRAERLDRAARSNYSNPANPSIQAAAEHAATERAGKIGLQTRRGAGHGAP